MQKSAPKKTRLGVFFYDGRVKDYFSKVLAKYKRLPFIAVYIAVAATLATL